MICIDVSITHNKDQRGVVVSGKENDALHMADRSFGPILRMKITELLLYHSL